MKIFKKIKCKFAVKDEVRLLSLKVIHYPNIALYLLFVISPERKKVEDSNIAIKVPSYYPSIDWSTVNSNRAMFG